MFLEESETNHGWIWKLEEEDDEKAAAILMKDAKALGIIQNAVSDQIFPRIANADSAKAAWELLYGEFHESRDCGIAIAILKSQEQRFGLHNAYATEKAFASFTVSSKGQNKNATNSGPSKAQKNWNPKGKPWESKGKPQWNNSAQTHSSSTGQEAVKPQCKVCSKYHFGECRYKGKPKCYNCDRFGHLARECTAEKTVQKANCASQMEVSGNLFYANCATTKSKPNGDWYIDSGCSNHMTGNVDLLVDVRTNVAGKVHMPTGALVNVAGMGSLVIDTTKGRKYIREVMYLPGLKENLLSVGQMDEHGYCLVFGDGMCKVFESSLMNCLIIKVQMKKNRCHPLSFLVENQLLMKASITHAHGLGTKG
ncbi:hypothetical protein Prudu_235S000700, partial [Prunus dulcis]